MSDFMITRPVGAELFHADGRTDRQDEANSRFRNFVNAPKMYFIYFLVSADTNEVATDFR